MFPNVRGIVQGTAEGAHMQNTHAPLPPPPAHVLNIFVTVTTSLFVAWRSFLSDSSCPLYVCLACCLPSSGKIFFSFCSMMLHIHSVVLINSINTSYERNPGTYYFLTPSFCCYTTSTNGPRQNAPPPPPPPHVSSTYA